MLSAVFIRCEYETLYGVRSRGNLWRVGICWPWLGASPLLRGSALHWIAPQSVIATDYCATCRRGLQSQRTLFEKTVYGPVTVH